MKRKLYFVFDQLPGAQTGGLITMYKRLAYLLRDLYEIEVISAFESQQSTFEGLRVHNIHKVKTDINLAHMKQLIRQKHFVRAAFVPWSIGLYLTQAEPIKKKIKRIFDEDCDPLVIAVSPAAACFMPKGVPFILEIHTFYEYFFEGSFVAKSQIKRMTSPTLTLFRTKQDATKAPESLHPSYMYNFVLTDGNREVADVCANRGKIIFMGRLEEEKDPRRLLRLAFMLKKVCPDFCLDIYGTGTLQKDMEREIERLNLQNQVCLKGFTSDKTIYKEYSMVWSTSKFEGFGLTIVEGKKFGLPTVSVRWKGGVDEVIHHEKDGYIADTDEEFVQYSLELITNPNKLKKMSCDAATDFARFSEDTARAQWQHLLNAFHIDK